MEIWTPTIINGKSDKEYFVSNLGRVKNCEGQILRYYKDRSGYLYVRLFYNGIYTAWHLHRLVYESFNPKQNRKKKYVVDHIDNDKKNNRLDNLQYITVRENTSKDRNKELPTGVFRTNENNRTKKFSSDIRINGKKKHLGRFHTITEARLAYLKALISIGEFYERKAS